MVSDLFSIELVKSIIWLIIVVDPLGNVPIFISVTNSLAKIEKIRIFNIAVLTGFSLLTLFALMGEWVLSIFRIELYSFRIAGGILLLFIALELLLKIGYEAKQYSPEKAGAVPLGVPLLVGPGAITTIIIVLKSYGVLTALLSVLIVAFITWVVLRSSLYIYKVLGKVGSNIISKVMAMLLAAIAVQYILEGVAEYISKSIF